MIKRNELFITTKLSNGAQRTGNVEKALKNSLRRLGTNYIDLYLMHWPNPGTYVDCWKQMENLYREGYAKAIGVCNFHEHHLEELFETATIKPMVNQVELHPLLSQGPLRFFCQQHNIQVQAYSPLARMHERVIKNPVLVSLAEKYDRSVPQIILNWLCCNDIVSIPKASKMLRIVQNLESLDFELSASDLEKIDGLNENFRVRHNPDNCDFSKL